MVEPSIETIVSRLEERIEALGLSDREVSIRATGKPDAVREIRRGKRPSDMRIRQLAEALDTTPAFLRGEPEPELDPRIDRAHRPPAIFRRGEYEMPRLHDFLPLYMAIDSKHIAPAVADLDLPILRRKTPILRIKFDEAPVTIPRPVTVRPGTGIFGLTIETLGIGGRFGLGDVMLVDPDADPEVRQDVLIRLKPKDGEAPYVWHVIFRKFGGFDGEYFETTSPDGQSSYERTRRSDVAAIYPVLSTAQILGWH